MDPVRPAENCTTETAPNKNMGKTNDEMQVIQSLKMEGMQCIEYQLSW